VIAAEHIDTLDPEQLRQAVRTLMSEIAFKQATIDKLTHEMAVLKRLKFAARSETFTGEQKSLLEEAIDADLEALAREIEREQPARPPRSSEGTAETPAAAGQSSPARDPA